MKRDVRLQGLSSDHHQALVLARSLTVELETRELDQREAWTEAQGRMLGERFDRELEAHFRIEEELLLPALRQIGGETILDLVDRTLQDHAFLRDRVSAARRGDGCAVKEFAQRLHEHVRFEERELFPACETHLPDSILDAVLRCSPKKP